MLPNFIRCSVLRASAGDGFRGRRLATALLRGVARGNFCDGGVKFRRGKSCAGGYVGSEVGCHVGWLHVAAGWSLTETGNNVRCMKKSTIVVVTNTSNIMSMVLVTTELDECCWRNG